MFDQIFVNFAQHESVATNYYLSVTLIIALCPDVLPLLAGRFTAVKKVKNFFHSKLLHFRHMIVSVDWFKLVSALDNLDDSITFFTDHLLLFLTTLFRLGSCVFAAMTQNG